MSSVERREFYTKIVGVTKTNDEGKQIQRILKEMSEEYCEGSLLELEHDADNPYDDNAIKVFYGGEHIGYIGRDLAKELAKLVDADIVEAEISEITGGADGKSFGCNIHVRIREASGWPDSESKGLSETLQETSKRTVSNYKSSYEPNEFAGKPQEASKAHAVSGQDSSTRKRVKYGIVGGSLVLAITLFGILYATEGVNKVFDGLDDQINESNGGTADGDYTVVTADPLEDASLDERNALKAHVLEVATDCGLPETSEIVLVSNRIEISVLTEYSIDAMPETWATILQEAESTGAAVQGDLPGYTVTIMYKDGEGNILLNVTDGACKYNVFEVEEAPVTEGENPPTITMAEYDQIEIGMTYFQVCDIIGGYGELLSEADLGLGSEYAVEMYMWEGEGSIGANANIMFQGGKVTSKAQFGLE